MAVVEEKKQKCQNADPISASDILDPFAVLVDRNSYAVICAPSVQNRRKLVEEKGTAPRSRFVTKVVFDRVPASQKCIEQSC